MVNDLGAGLRLLGRNVRPLAGGIVGGKSAYEHIATVYHQPTNQLFVAYRSANLPLFGPSLRVEGESMGGVGGSNLTTEVYINKITRRSGRVDVIRRIDEWLEAVEDDTEFATIAQFLVRHRILDREILTLQRSQPGIDEIKK